MTQSYNLSQLANNLNSSGLLDASAGLVNATPIANGGTNATTAAGARTNLGVAAAVYSVPSGGIIMWRGTTAPTGWYLCDGSNGTPDLRNRFIVSTGSAYALDAQGGSADAIVVSHNHSATTTSTDSGHTHSYNNGENPTVNLFNGSSYQGFAVGPIGTFTTNSSTANITSTTTIGSTGASGTNANLPPYYALAYIMKS